jgi:hypothetical protein
MSSRDALTIAIPGLALLAVLTIPSEPRPTRRPWPTARPPRRTQLAIAFSALPIIAIAHATT